MQSGKANSQHDNFLPLSTAVVLVRKLPGGLTGLEAWSSTGLGTHSLGSFSNFEEMEHWWRRCIIGAGCELTLSAGTLGFLCAGEMWFASPLCYCPLTFLAIMDSLFGTVSPNRLLLLVIVFYHGNRNKAKHYYINECKHLTFWIFIFKEIKNLKFIESVYSTQCTTNYIPY